MREAMLNPISNSNVSGISHPIHPIEPIKAKHSEFIMKILLAVLLLAVLS